MTSPMDVRSCCSKCGSGITWELLETRTLGPHPRPTESDSACNRVQFTVAPFWGVVNGDPWLWVPEGRKGLSPSAQAP